MSINGDDSSRRSSVNSFQNGADEDRIKELCDTCQSLQLGVHRFKVQSSSRRDVNSAADRVLRSSTMSLRLGTLQDVRSRSSQGCPLCLMISDYVEEQCPRRLPGQPGDDTADQQLQQAICSITWEIDGREVAAPRSAGDNPRNLVRGLTRRIRVRWNHPRLSDAYLVYVAPETYSRTTSDADRVWDKSSLFLGRKFTKHTENQALVKSWLDLCQTTHQGPCRQEHPGRLQAFSAMISHSYFGVIDVQNMQLTQLPYRETAASYGRLELSASRLFFQPYVALSYVWGASQAYTTTTKNVMLHRMHGGLEKVLRRLPKAIQDAIDLVRRLGFKYLWIDALCIVQDSPRSWKLNAYNMDLIYGNAALTICAADGEDAAAGLRAMRPETHNTKQLRRTVKPGLSLMLTRPPEMYIRASKWNERAWTFQERLLSRRCLIFTNGRVYFQCRSTGMSEDIYADRKGAGWSLDLVDAPMQMFRQLDNRAIWVYMRCVELYTERKLTQPKDILAAFSGMSNLMRDRMRSPFIHGLPSSHFDLALLWEPIKSAERRQEKDSTKIDNFSIPDFPSWSWAGWIGPAAYKDSIVGALLGNVSEWLDNHTWIRWWVRDGHGDLRPLWDPARSAVDSSNEMKWRGYSRKRVEGEELPRNSSRRRANDRYVSMATDHHATRRNSTDEWNEPGSDATTQTEGHSSDDSEDEYSEYTYSDGGSGREEQDEHVELIRLGQENRRTRKLREREWVESKPAIPPLPHRQRCGSCYPGAQPVRVTSKPRTPGARGPAPLPQYPPRPSPIAPQPRKSRSPRHAQTELANADYYSPPLSEERDATSRPARGASVHYDDYPRRSSFSPPVQNQTPRLRRDSILSEHPTHNSQFFDMFFENNGEEFSITLKDYPYRVVKAPFDPNVDRFEFPLLPILQFRTHHTWLYIKPATASTEDNNSRKRASLDVGKGQVRCHIADDVGDWCGSIVLDAQWVARAPSLQEFIAISDAKSFTPTECHVWTYYIPKEREQSEWDLYYVLLIERKDEKWERVGTGKVFKEAFRGAKWKAIVLG